MSAQWETAKRCQNAMSYLLLSIQRQRGKHDIYLPFDFDSDNYSVKEPVPGPATPRPVSECGPAVNAKRQKFSHPERNEGLIARVDGEEAVHAESDSMSGFLHPPTPTQTGAISSPTSPPPILLDTNRDSIPDKLYLEPADRRIEQRTRLRAQHRFYTQTSGSVSPTNDFGPSPSSISLPPPLPPTTAATAEVTMDPSMSGNSDYYISPDAWNNDLASFASMASTQSPLNLSSLEDPQWPGRSTSATNFDLNMTDLFQGSAWESLLEVWNPQHAQSSPQVPQMTPSQSSPS
jgi:hypothetical protein